MKTRHILFNLTVTVSVALAGTGQAQRKPAAFPAPTPAPTEDPTLRRGAGHAGIYQGNDGAWHTVQIENWENDRVYLSDAGRIYKAYLPTELRRFATMGDTVVAARDLVVVKRRFPFVRRRVLLPAVFGLQLYRGGGFQLLSYDSQRPATLLSALSSQLLLRHGQDEWQILPTNTAKFNQLMLKLLGDNPDLVAGLRAKQYHPRRDAAQLLERYSNWRINQYLQFTSQPAR
ncbi:hypothetical protein MTX78_03890 [Hymenobacter tibetensis]|uniref:DUF4476 domain-containing protein n=1 Tax=Hymenobacter tibetensis TaxID=497967 RepID=A0ABY4CZP0_9BACT|nr:hypothetical protein [Hymenobacter tibetensis]UOG75740.1 hypothetical protein MTX78_03890 [Hymenobacter tibetensis]